MISTQAGLCRHSGAVFAVDCRPIAAIDGKQRKLLGSVSAQVTGRALMRRRLTLETEGPSRIRRVSGDDPGVRRMSASPRLNTMSVLLTLPSERVAVHQGMQLVSPFLPACIDGPVYSFIAL